MKVYNKLQVYIIVVIKQYSQLLKIYKKPIINQLI